MRKRQVRSALSCGDLSAEVTRKSIRTIRIRIAGGTGQIRISAPHGTKDDAILALLTKHRQWILDRQREAQIQKSIRPALVSGAELSVLGRAHVLYVEQGAPRRTAVSTDGILTVTIRAQDGQDVVSMLIDRWLDGEIRNSISELARTYEPQMGVKMGALAIRAMRSRWGSCNVQTGRICINRVLAWESPDLLEYILVHELAHLIERGHTRQFYAIVDAHYPNRKQAELKLRGLSRTL